MPRVIAPHKQQQLVQQSLQQHYPSINTCSTSTDELSNQQCEVITPIINKLSQSSKQFYTPLQQYQRIHLATLHMSPTMIHDMIRHKTIDGLPASLLPEIKKYNCQCYICMLTKTNKLPRGCLEDKTQLPPFGRLHLDFHFFNVVSICGFSSALAAVCGSTSYMFNFPTKSRSPPVQIAMYLIRTIRSMGHQIHII